MGARLKMIFINETETIGTILASGTTTISGDMVATLFFLLLFLMVMAMMFGIPLEFLAVIILPFCLAVGSYYASFLIPIVIIVFYVSFIVAKNYLFK
jgi:hypothetical protein